jgi:hypothetical protein
MDSFDKKVSDLYNKNVFDEVPQDFAWSEMNKGIYEKLDKKESKKRPIAWFWFAGVSILIFGILFYFINISISNGKQISNNTISKESTIINKSPLKNKESFNLTHEKIVEETSKSLKKDQRKIANQRTSKSFNDLPTKFIQSNSLEKENNHENLNQSKEISRSSYKTLYNVNKNFDNSEVSNNSLFIKPSTIENTKSTIRSKIKANPIANIIVTLKSKTEKTPILINKLATTSLKSNTNNKSKMPYGISAFGGTLIGFRSYTGAQVRSETSKWIPGYYVGFKVPIYKLASFDIYSSFEHKFAVQEFDIHRTDSTKVSLENTLIGISTNALTGRKTQVHADTIGYRITTHDFTHYNTFRTNTLNIGVTKLFDFGSFQLETSAGALYSFLVISKGKTIGNEHNIIDYDTQFPIYRSSNFGFEMGLDINYSIFKNLKINAHIRGEYSLSNWSKEQNVKFNPLFIKLGGGIKYKF